MINEKGSLSINSENILPIIKKWLYSDTDIFLRELVSNGSDAITKLSRLAASGETDLPEDEKFFVRVTLDKDAGTITVSDNGIGMTADEVMRFINQIAFSGATEFIEKHKDKMEAGTDIIGHFGLGFYSAFMVADTVRIDTLSCQEGAEPVRWTSDGGTQFEMSPGTKDSRGTDITLHIGDDSKEFLDEYRLRGILRKYCSFMPADVFFAALGDEHDGQGEDAPINDKNPLWNRKPQDVTDDEYKEFYHKTFTDFNDPLFWIHLNMDYPFRLKGILYFPKLSHELESVEGQVKLYNNQVFIAENIKEVIPEFLLLLKGTMDCPDLPLNVSRSALQNDGYVSKMSAYIIKKVADKLTELFTGNRDQYNKYWDDINPFIKYGCLKEGDFYDKVKGAIVFKTTKGDYLTLQEYKERNTEKAGNNIVYVTDEKRQAQYLILTDEQGVDAVLMGTRIDTPFMSFIEGGEGRMDMENRVKFIRIDSDLGEILRDGTPDADIDPEALAAMFKTVLGNEKLEVKAESLKNAQVPAIVTLPEESRRMKEMSKMFSGMEGAMFGAFDVNERVVLNTKNSLVRALYGLKDNEERKDDVDIICRQLYDLALMSHRQMDSESMNRFITRSAEMMMKLIQ